MMTHIEKFTIDVKDEGMIIKASEGQHLFFTPIEALMLLDILKAEEGRLKNSVEKKPPLPIKITL